MSTSTANISGVSIIPCEAMTSAPSPRLAPMNSPTTAPTSASTTATRRPARMPGRPAGSFRRNSVWRARGAEHAKQFQPLRLAPAAAPVSVFSISGKKQISAVITTVDVMPKPNHTMNSGISASLGITWLATT